MDLTSWMGTIPDDTCISRITIPGTHDSASYNASDAAKYVQTQSRDLFNQLEVGCRFLDIRLVLDDGVLELHHGNRDLDLNFGQMVALCQAFLARYPRESILMSVKNEDSDADPTAFAQAVQKAVNTAPALWWTGDTLPKLGEVRGKIVLMRRFPLNGVNPPFGIMLNMGPNGTFKQPLNFNAGQYLCYEDLYKVSSYREKEDAIQANLDLAKGDSNPNDLFITFTSGYIDMVAPPNVFARHINPWLLENVKIDKRTMGIIPMDFVDGQLCQFFLGSNPWLA
jgi:1-phosphatidylinositol phosphodiesterase